jgi:(S)-2-hydroxyglutarate dehydrogenase
LPESRSRSFDVVVVGGGIVGMAVADAVLDARPDARVAVLEKEPRLAEHASGRNSGVLHAGFYYHPDSAKARLTRRGNQLLRAFCAEEGVAVRDAGKVVVATGPEQLPALEELFQRGLANDVPLEVVDQAGLARLEPLARTHEQALWSPSTASADPAAVLEALASRVRRRGAEVRLGSPVTAAGPGWVETQGARLEVGHLVNAAGLYADEVARWFGVGEEYRMLPFKGLYWYAAADSLPLQRHVYPVPDPRFPFLGVHLTVTAAGRVKAGPTAIPALWRESYGGRGGLDRGEVGEVVRTLPRFVAGQRAGAPRLLAAEVPKMSRRYLMAQARRLVPSAHEGLFRERGRPGIRAQLIDLRTNRLEMDFVVRSGPASTHVLNAVSPGWTTALAMAQELVPGILGGGTPAEA